MTHSAPPTGNAQPDDLDRLLSAYFRQQLPKDWPAFDPGPTAEPARVRGGSLSRSRLTLAASVAALLGAGLYLTSGDRPQPTGSTPASGPGLLQGSKAEGNGLMRHLKDQPPAPEPKQ